VSYLGQSLPYYDPTNAPVPQLDAERFNGNASLTAFTMARQVTTATDVDVFVDNVRQEPITAYAVANKTLTFTEAPPAGTGNIYIIYRNSYGNQTFATLPDGSITFAKLANNIKQFTVETFTGDGSTTAFVCTDTPANANSLLVSIDGVVQNATTNFALATKTITFTSAPASAAAIVVKFLGFRTDVAVSALSAGSVTTAALADNSVTAAKIAPGTIVDSDIADNAVTTAKILNANVTTAKIADANVTTAKITDANVTAGKLAANAVTTAKIADDAVTLAKMAPGTDGNLISFDASGNPVAVATGTATQVLTSAGAGAPPTFADAAAGGIEWQSSVVTASTLTAVAGRGYWINTTSNTCTITLPSSASVGDQIIFVDYVRTWATNFIELNSNGLKYQGEADTSVVKYNLAGQHINIVYSGATEGWIPVSDEASAQGPTLPFSATGGTIVTYSGYKAHVFTSSGNFVVSGTAGNVDRLIVAGAGAGGGRHGGGGGAGGMLVQTAQSMAVGTHAVVIGAGAAAIVTNKGANGSNTTFASQTAIGGGGGGAYAVDSAVGSAGGSGGGGGSEATTVAGGAGTSGQGNAGGTGFNGTGDSRLSGGGGGASAVGVNGNGNTGVSGDGGAGTLNAYDNNNYYYAGGGGGGSWSSSIDAGDGGSGGGAGGAPANGSPQGAVGSGSTTGRNNGGNGYVNASSGASVTTGGNGGANTGGGGGGAGQSASSGYTGIGGAGGSGVVIIRYAV